MRYDSIDWVKIELKTKNTILGSVFLFLFLLNEERFMIFLNELKKFDSALWTENKRWVEIDEIIFLLCFTGHISWLSLFAKKIGTWSFASGVVNLIYQFYKKFNRPISYFLSLNEHVAPGVVFCSYNDRLLTKGLLEKSNKSTHASLLARNILNELNLKINWSFFQKLELFLKEYPSLLALFISIFWSITAILIAIFDK